MCGPGWSRVEPLLYYPIGTRSELCARHTLRSFETSLRSPTVPRGRYDAVGQVAALACLVAQDVTYNGDVPEGPRVPRRGPRCYVEVVQRRVAHDEDDHIPIARTRGGRLRAAYQPLLFLQGEDAHAYGVRRGGH
jgi:hypothetical protein